MIPVTANASRLWAVKCSGHNKIYSMINYWAIHNFTREHQVLLLSLCLFHVRPKIPHLHSEQYIISYKNFVHMMGTSKTAILRLSFKLVLTTTDKTLSEEKQKETWWVLHCTLKCFSKFKRSNISMNRQRSGKYWRVIWFTSQCFTNNQILY